LFGDGKNTVFGGSPAQRNGGGPLSGAAGLALASAADVEGEAGLDAGSSAARARRVPRPTINNIDAIIQ
jgi:hypothetical protein